MDQYQPMTETTTTVYPPTPSRGLFGTGIPSTIAFTVALLIFLLPFAEIKCGGTTFMNKKGVDFALNKEWNIASKSMGEDLFKDGTKKPSNKEGTAPIMVIVAMGMAVLGIFVSLIRSKSGALLTAVVGAAGVASLIGFMVMLKGWFDREMAKDAAEKAKDAASELGNVKLTLDFTIFFYVCLACFLVATILAFLRMQSKRS